MQIESAFFVDKMRRSRRFRQILIRIGDIRIGTGTVQWTRRSRDPFCIRSGEIVHLEEIDRISNNNNNDNIKVYISKTMDGSNTLTPRVGVDGLASVTVITGWDVGGGFVFLTGDILVSFFLTVTVSLAEQPKYLQKEKKGHRIEHNVLGYVFRVPTKVVRRRSACKKPCDGLGKDGLTQKKQVHQ